jgi:hypothetical protein
MMFNAPEPAVAFNFDVIQSSKLNKRRGMKLSPQSTP